MDIMVDLETMSTQPNAAIVAIGAVAFDPSEDTEHDTYYQVVALQSQDRHIDPATVIWWLGQSREAQDALLKGAAPLPQALRHFTAFCRKHNVHHVWANSPDFDCVILSHALKAEGLIVPWKYFNTRCVRTIKDLAHPNGDFPQFQATAHNALVDAQVQAAAVQYAWKLLFHRQASL